MSIIVDIDCDNKCCGKCEFFDNTIRGAKCFIYAEWLIHNLRCQQCLDAEVKTGG